MRNRHFYVYTIAVAILYLLIYLEHSYGLIFPYGTLIGRNLVIVFVPTTIFGLIAIYIAFRKALLSEVENRFREFILLILISTTWFFMSMHFISHNRLNMSKSVSDEIKGGNSKPSLSETNGYLFLNNRGLRTIPPEIFRMANLKVLGLQGNQINLISPEIASSPLIELQIYSNNLSSLPNELSMTQIKYLSLGSNHLTTFPDDFRFPASLISLHLDNNKLVSLSNSLTNCTNLEHLNLWGNQITTLPESVAKLTKLKSLSLVKNKLTEFPQVILNLNELTELGLAFNQISSLPQELASMSKLKSVNLNGNPIPMNQIKEFREKMPYCKISFEN